MHLIFQCILLLILAALFCLNLCPERLGLSEGQAIGAIVLLLITLLIAAAARNLVWHSISGKKK